MSEQMPTPERSRVLEYASTPAANLRYWARTPRYRVALSPYNPSKDPAEQIEDLPFRPQHRYTQSFDPTKPQIRLLKLLPYTTNHRWESTIRCTLSIVSLDANPTYLALSYTWNEIPGSPIPILVDGFEFNATRNLVEALKHLRHETECVCLWVDAICINQARDSTEKECQIPLMQRIYRQASMVVAWLGVGTEESDRGMRKLVEIAKNCVYLIPQDDQFYSNRLRYMNQVLSRTKGSPFALKDIRSIFKRSWWSQIRTEGSPFPLQEICSIFKRSWWFRIWCLQEVELAREVLLICGSLAIPFGLVWNAYDALKAFGLMTTPLHPLAEISKSIRKDLLSSQAGIIQSRIRWNDSARLFALKDKISQTNGMKATDPRDLVYAILSVVRDAGEMGIKYEGGLKCSTVWTRVAKALIVQNKNLKLLGWCQAYRQEELPASNLSFEPSPERLQEDTRPTEIVENDDRRDLPSWVPDLSSLFRFALSNLGELGDKPLFTASKNTPFSFETDILITQQSRTLTISGFQLDNIHIVSPLPPKSEKFPTNFHLAQILKLINSRSPNQDSHDEEAFYRTPICDLELTLESNTDQSSFRRVNYSLYSSFQACNPRFKPPIDEPHPEAWRKNKRVAYERTMAVCFQGRNSFLTEKGYVGLGPVRARVGDAVCVVGGADVPLLLRRVGDGRWRLIGECFVHGVMDGEFSGVGCVREMFDLV